MNTCSTCRHWSQLPPAVSGWCALISHGGDSGTPFARISADGSLFITHSTFGCTEHEPVDKPTKETPA